MGRMKVLVTGFDGQLGKCTQKQVRECRELSFFFSSRENLDITNKELINGLFFKEKFDFVINCAAYTNVEQAEKEPKKAFLVNAEGVKNLAEVCKNYNTTLIHISTDYVFDGSKNTPYTEEDNPNPINEYGKSKLAGEQYIQDILVEHFIIRTSWLYSQFGKNFYKTVLEKSDTEKKLTITTGEVGTPTNANDLAKFLLYIISVKSKKYGLYHFSNLGSATWYDFAKEILSLSGKLEQINLEKADNYPTFAERPKYSVLDKTKIKVIFSKTSIDWKKSLKNLRNDF